MQFAPARKTSFRIALALSWKFVGILHGGIDLASVSKRYYIGVQVSGVPLGSKHKKWVGFTG